MIRKLQESDFWNGFLETLDSLRETGLTAEQGRDILQNRPDNIHTYVLLDNDQVVSTVTLFIEKKFIHQGGVVGHIEDVVTHPNHRNKGYATQLLKHIIDEAKKEGCYKIILDCNLNVAPFYEKIGFCYSSQCMRINL